MHRTIAKQETISKKSSNLGTKQGMKGLEPGRYHEGKSSVNNVLSSAAGATVLDCSRLYDYLLMKFLLVSSPKLAVQGVQCQPERSGNDGSSIPPHCYSLALVFQQLSFQQTT